ncbi:MAG TPA: hypothetical protein VF941_21580 [Clostridia bacterium]
MKKFITVDPETLSFIEKMVRQDSNLNKIINALKEKRNIELSAATVSGIIKRSFRKVWDKELKLWVDFKDSPKDTGLYLQLSIDDIFQSTYPEENE